MSLGAAIERARELYKNEGRARVDAQSVVRTWGYNSLNGASLRVLSALRQYGLLEGSNDEVRLSPVALTLLLEPESSPEYKAEMIRAFESPALFAEIVAEFGQDVPSDGALISYLVRKKNIGEPAAKTLIKAFRESLELVSSATALPLGREEASNATEIVRTTEPANIMSINEIKHSNQALDLSFSWPLSANTVLLIKVAGDIPSPGDVADLPMLLDLAKGKILREVEKAASTNSPSHAAADYEVESV